MTLPRALIDILGRINQQTVRMRSRPVLPYLKGDLLDIGCGRGYLAQFVGEGQRYVGVDVNPEKIAHLKRLYAGRPGFEFWSIDVDADDAVLPSAIADSAFNTITLLAVIEHLRRPQRVLREARRLLAKRGRLLLTTPSSAGDRLGNIIPLLVLGTRNLPYPHMSIYNRRSLAALLNSNGFRIEKYRRFELGMNQLVVCSQGLPG